MTEDYNLNFSFVRHGYGCHNALRVLRSSNILPKTEDMVSLGIYADPELSPLGVDASTHNGCIIAKIIRNMHKVTGNEKLNVGKIDIVACSPLIRSMETAYFMTRTWKNPPSTIFVMPHLREIDEASDDKFSKKSRYNIDMEPAYAMKSIPAQKEYLRQKGILQYFDFSFVEDPQYYVARKEPGDVKRFVHWFVTVFMRKAKVTKVSNVFVVTHAGVLRDFANEGFGNNSGFMVSTNISRVEDRIYFKELVSFNSLLPSMFFHDYKNPDFAVAEFYCPSSRCGQVCSKAKFANKKLLRLKNTCEAKPDESV